MEDSSGILGWLIRKGIARDRKTAEIILIAIAVICFAVAGYFIFGAGGGEKYVIPPGMRIVHPPDGAPPRLEPIR